MFRFGRLIAVIGALASHATSAQEIDWATAIQAVQSKQSEYCEHARRLDGTCFAGTMYNGHRYAEHLCGLAARHIGLKDHMERIEAGLKYPVIDAELTGHDAAIFAATLDAWIAAASRLLDKDERYLRTLWNSECVGNFGISLSDWLGDSLSEADFEVSGSKLFVYGPIDADFFDNFREAILGNPQVEVISLGSGGGSVRNAFAAGRLIRSLELATTIHGDCMSACPLVFAGGVERTLWASESRLGFHMVSRNGVPVRGSDKIYHLIELYLYSMGADGSQIVRWMLSAPPSDMYEPSPAHLCSSSIATWIQRIC